MSKKTGIVKDTRYLQHSAGFAHPESPERLAAIYEMLDNPLMHWKFTQIEPREATHKEIETIHSPSYVEFIASTAGQTLCISRSRYGNQSGNLRNSKAGSWRGMQCH